MASVADVLLARDAAKATPPADAELVGPPEPPKKRSVADVLLARPAPPPPPAPKPTGTTAGASLGEIFRRDKERAETPELLRRPEEPVDYKPSPDEPPELLKRPYEEPPPGAYGVPTTFERYAIPATRIGVPIVSGIGSGFLAGPAAPVVAPLAGAAATTASELALQKYETARGLRKEVSPYGVTLQGALGAIQGLPLPPGMAAPARFAARTAEGTAFGTGATTLGTLAEEKRLPTKEELAWGAGMGAAFGAAGGGFEAYGVPYLHQRSPEFIGPRPEGELSWRQRRTAQKFATSADQLAGETTAPPVGERQQLVRQDDGTYLLMPDTPEDFRERMQAGRPPLRSEAAPVVEPPRMVTQPGETIGGGPGEFVGPPAPEQPPPGSLAAVQAARASEFVGPPAPEMTPHPIGSDVLFRDLGEQERTTPGRIVAHDVNAETGEPRIMVDDGTGVPLGRRMDDVELAPVEPSRVQLPWEEVEYLRSHGLTDDEIRARQMGNPEIAERPAPPISEPAPGYVRVYHAGDVDPASGGGRWVSPDPEWVRNYRPGSRVYYADVPESSPLLRKTFDDTGTGMTAPYVPFEMPEDLTHMLRPVEELSGAGRGAPPPEGPPGAAPPLGGEEPSGEPAGPWGRPPTFRRYPGVGEALTGDEIAAQRHADPERVTRAIESVDREFGVLDDESRARLKQQIVDNQERFEYLGRGKQTMERTRGLGRDYLVDIDAAKLEPKGTTWNPEQTQAMKNHIAGLDLAIQDAKIAYDRDPTPQHGLILQKAVQDQIDAFMIFRARGAEAGRTINIYKGTAEELASGNQRLLMAALRRGVPPQKLAEIIQSTKPEDVIARAEMLMAYSDRGGLYKRGRNLLKTLFISDLLSGPGPHQRNTLGNSVRAYMATPAAELFGAAHERMMGVPEGERLVRAGEAAKHFVGMYDSLPDAIHKTAEILKRGYTMEQAATYDLPLNEAFIGAHPAIRGAVNAIPRGLGGMDMFFRVQGQEGSLYAQAFTRAKNEALVERTAGTLPLIEGTPHDMTFDARVEQLYRHYQANPTPEMMTQAAEEATRGVYQERDKIARVVTFIREYIPFGDFIIPFVTTSTNLAKQGLHFTPAGYLMPSTAGRNLLTGKAVEGVSPRTRVLHIGEAHAGTVGMLLAPLALYAMGGKIHGSGPADWDERQEWLKTHTPNSIELGGVNVGFNWMGPFAVPLAGIGNLWDKYDEIKQKQGYISPHDMDDLAQEMILGTAESVLDQPYLQGLSNFIDMVTHLRGKDADRYRSKFLKDIATGFIPGSGFLRWAEQVGDPTIRESRTIGEKAMGGIPGLSERVPPKLDPFGEPQQVRTIGGPAGRAIFPFPVEYSERDPLREELARQGLKLSPPSSLTLKPGEEPLSREEDLAVKQAKGRQVRQDLEDLLSSDAYLNAEPETQKKMLKGYVGRTRARIGARAKAFRETQGIAESTLRY